MNDVEQDKMTYRLARDFLLGLSIDGVTEELLDRYLNLPQTKPQPQSIAGRDL